MLKVYCYASVHLIMLKVKSMNAYYICHDNVVKTIEEPRIQKATNQYFFRY